MKIRRYVTANMRTAIREVRNDLGPDAVILSNRPVPEGVEVTAAIDYEDGRADGPGDGRAEVRADGLGAGAPPKRSGPSGLAGLSGPFGAGPEPTTLRSTLDSGVDRLRGAGADVTGPAQNSLTEVREEIRNLRGLLEEQLVRLAWDEIGRRQPRQADALRQLVALGIDRDVAIDVVRSLPEGGLATSVSSQVREALTARLRTTPGDVLETGGAVALLGPTGVGKTTTAAKLAARFAIRRGPRAVALITTDSYRIGAHEQLRSFARIMDIAVRVANDESELRVALEHFSERDLVLIDTAGLSQRDARYADQASLIGRISARVTKYVVLSATAQPRGAEETLAALGSVAVDGCVVTKVDESVSLGPVLGALVEHDLPIAYFTDGQRVPEDLRRGDPPALVELANTLVSDAPPVPGVDLAAVAERTFEESLHV